MHVKKLFISILPFLPFRKDCEHPGHCMTDPNRPTCTGITYENGTFVNGKCRKID